MTSSVTSQGGLKAGPLYSFINELTNIFHDNQKTSKDIIIKLPVHSRVSWDYDYNYINMYS